MTTAARAAAIAATIAAAWAVGAGAQTVFKSENVYHVMACGPVSAGHARCHAHIVSDVRGNLLVNRFAKTAAGPTTPAGFSPSSLLSAYGVPAGGGVKTTIVAIVDAYGYPNAATDLATYRATYGLPACTAANGCFTKVNERGQQSAYPAENLGWAQEQALDLDMESAMCPNCKLILVEASSNSFADLAAAENMAASLGAHVISNSYGGAESGSQSYNVSYNHVGVAITASTGDDGYAAGPQFPATSPYVTAVGGTDLSKASNARGWTETVWADGGSGCSAVYAKPSWQASATCKTRMEADVSADADPSTGVAVYGPTSLNASGWLEFGGTSVSAQIVGGVYAVNGGPVSYAENPYGYAGTSSLNDITTGTNGTCGGSYYCTAKVGYDGPTGLGTPNGTKAF